MSLLLTSLYLSASSLPLHPQLKPQWQRRWRHRCFRLATFGCIRFGVIKTNWVVHAPEGHNAQELCVQRLIHRLGHRQEQRVRKRTNCSFLLSNRSIEGFLFDSLIGRFPADSKIYIFGRVIKSIKILNNYFNMSLHDYGCLPYYGMMTTFYFIRPSS